MTDTVAIGSNGPAPVERAAPESGRVPHSAPAIAKANGIELCYDTFGDPKASPLVLIMGLASQMIAWDDTFCARLASRGYWVIRFDNRDIGLSTKFNQYGTPNIKLVVAAHLIGIRKKIPYTLGDLANDVVGLLDTLGIERAHIVGASMGGMVAQEVAIRYPNRVRTLTVIMSTSGERGLPGPTPEALAVLAAPAPADKQAYIENYRKTWRVLRGPGSFPDDEARDAERAEANFARGLNPSAVGRQLAAILTADRRGRALAKLTVPTLVVHGTADPLVPVQCGIDIAERVPGAKRLIIEGMGHALPISAWNRIIDAIAQHAVSA
jgi:pimeloyl-ACP methyl ester carboxylesterase